MCNPSLGQNVVMDSLGQRHTAHGSWELLSWIPFLPSLFLVPLSIRDLCFRGKNKKPAAGKNEMGGLKLS